MTHPYLLHAAAAAWSLHNALVQLEQRAREAAEDAAAGSRAGDVSIPSQVFGRRTALGGHGDPTGAAALGAWRPPQTIPEAVLLADLMRVLDQAAGHLPGAPGMDPIRRIRQAIPGMRPSTAARTGEALTVLDRAARRQLGVGPALAPLPGNPPCPSCRLQMLQQTAAGSIVCTADCHCQGDGCRCGMLVREAGVQHIWTPEQLATRTAA